MDPTQQQQFRNNLHGWMGVVKIGPKGDDRGASVRPGGTVWLSEAEQVLTANAPRDPKDNPFVEQEWPVEDPETGEVKLVKITPLTPISDQRYVPAQRFVPGVAGEGVRGVRAAQEAATGPEPVVVTTDDEAVARREAEVLAAPPMPSAPAIPLAAQRAADAAAAERAAQEAAQEAAQGALPPQAPPEPVPAPPVAPEPPQEPQDMSEPAPEETAVQVDHAIGEETGAALPPTGDAEQGSFIASEEVGTPTAPQQPPPFTPPEE